MQRLTLNFLGVTVADHASSRAFYERVLGFRTGQEPKPRWAFFGATREERAPLPCQGMVFELFGHRSRPSRRQVAFPWTQVRDPQRIAAELKDSWKASCPGFGDGFEVAAPENIRWMLVPPDPRCGDLDEPIISGVELRVHDLDAMRDFYTKIIGLRPGSADDRSIVLRQSPSLPILVLVRASIDIPLEQRSARAVAFDAPVWFSCETKSIEKSAAELRKHHVRVTQDVQRQEWGGIDMIIDDPEGNPIQIVEYLDE